MKITFSQKQNDGADALVVVLSDSLKFGTQAEKINKDTGDALKKAIKSRGFKGDKKEVLTIVAPANVKYDQIVLVGIGKENKITDIVTQELGATVYCTLNSIKSKNASIVVENISNDNDVATKMAYGAVLRSYRFGKYKTKEKEDKLPTLKIADFIVSDSGKAELEFDKLQMIADGVFLTRDVVTEPPNHLYPESYAKRIKEDLSGHGVKITILSVKQLEKLGMGALLGVGQGSSRDSHVVIMEYNGGDPKEQPLAFVGKGVTFDTGGISIKPSVGMEDMKYDMGGSAVVVGLMKALAGRKANVNAVGIVGLVENMPGHNAQRPSDVVTSMSGQTVEVLNTDAEGRLVLADILTYVQQKHEPQIIVDLATLTGAIVIALGDEYAGVFSNNDKLSKKLEKAGESTDEKLWRFPLGDAYDKMLDSPIADMQNISAGRGAGSITAAQFLQRFIENDTPWAHLDIAGVSWTKKAKGVCPKGATAFGVRLLDKFVNDNYED
jgi:leucyl aminopeptidase